MSSSRLKERGGGGGCSSRPDASTPRNPKPSSFPLRPRTTPVSGKENNGRTSLSSSGGGKSSVPRQRPPPPTDPKKPVLVPAAVVRWSTSSLVRGKSPTPLSNPDSRRRSSGANAFPPSRSQVKKKAADVLASASASRTSKLSENGRLKPSSSNRTTEAKSTNSKAFSDFNRKLAENVEVDVVSHVVKDVAQISTNKTKPALDKSFNGLRVSGSYKNGDDFAFTSKFVNSVSSNAVIVGAEGVEKGKNGVSDTQVVVDNVSSKTGLTRSSSDGVSVSESLNENKCRKIDCVKLPGKYSTSKLHEKLALLEGKVQRIATDIKRTKEMLDSNDPDSSKLILNDIQTKILGIEKAVGNVIDGSEGVLGQGANFKECSTQVKHVKEGRLINDQGMEKIDSQQSSRSLDCDELEARFFPHHRLLRNRTSSDITGEAKTYAKHSHSSATVNGSLSSLDENTVALEFLASLDVANSKINTSTRTGGSSVSVMIQEMVSESVVPAAATSTTKKSVSGSSNDNLLMSDEKLDEFDEQENKNVVLAKEESDDSLTDRLFKINHKPSTGGWFVSEGEAVLLTHSDGSCSYYDIINTELKTLYMPPPCATYNMWGDCWLIRAPGADGCAGRYVVAASAGNALQPGFCSWDFYRKDIQAIRLEGGTSSSGASTSSSRIVLGQLSSAGVHKRSSVCTPSIAENQLWWYRPCGYLIASASSRQNVISAYDVRDGGLSMTWAVQSPVAAMEYSSPLQWRSRGKMVVAETEAISLWDVNSLNPQPLLSVACASKKILALHMNNSDAELGGGVRQRVTMSEAEGNDGVFSTQDTINVFDFRLPSGVGLKISKNGSTAHSIYSRGDSILVGCTETRPTLNCGTHSVVQHFSLRKGKLVASYLLPDAKVHSQHSAITQVWGNSSYTMGICGMGLFVFDTHKEGDVQLATADPVSKDARETVGPNNLCHPSFDYLGERVLVISKDQPAMWRYLF